jgi:hypothetical protein
MLVGHERGVVAEAAGAARVGRERPLAAPLDDVLVALRRHVGQRADVGHAAAGRRLAQQLGEVLLVGGVLAGEARRADPGRPAEGLGGDPRVVGDRGHPGRAAAARALPSAFSANVSPVSGGSSTSSGSATISCGAMSGPNSRTLWALRVERTSLTRPRSPPPEHPQVGDAARRELEERVEVRARQRRALGGGLDLDERALAGHDDVRVDLGGGVLAVVEVEHRRPADHAARDRRDAAGQRVGLQPSLLAHAA